MPRSFHDPVRSVRTKVDLNKLKLLDLQHDARYGVYPPPASYNSPNTALPHQVTFSSLIFLLSHPKVDNASSLCSHLRWQSANRKDYPCEPSYELKSARRLSMATMLMLYAHILRITEMYRLHLYSNLHTLFLACLVILQIPDSEAMGRILKM